MIRASCGYASRRLALALLFGLFIGSATAQPFPPLSGVVATDSDRLDVGAVNAAAQALQEQGASVLVLFVEAPIGQTFADAEAYLDSALEHYGFSQSGLIDSTLFAVFVGTAALEGGQRPLYLSYGDRLAPAFERFISPSETIADSIRLTRIVPRLSEGDYTRAMTAGLEEAARQLESYRSPAQPPPPEAAQRPNLRWLVGVLLVLGLLVAASRLRPLVQRRREEERARKELTGRLQAVKGELSALLIDLGGKDTGIAGHDPYLPEDPDEQLEMAMLKSFAQAQRPEVMPPLQEGYARAREALNEALEGFRELGDEEALEGRPSPSRLEDRLARYEALLAKAKVAEGFTKTLAETWRELREEAARAPDLLASLRESLCRERERYQALAAKANLPPAEETFAPLQAQLEEAEKALDDKPLLASQESERASMQLTALTEATDAFVAAQETLDNADRRLAEWEAQGFKGRERWTEAGAALAEAATLLKEGRLDELHERLRAGRRLAEEAVTEAGARVALHQANAERLAALEEAGEAASRHIERGAEAFDAANAYAPSSWRDIRGNGSESQKAAERAFELFEAAREANRLDGPQDFEGAAAAIDEAFAELERAHALISAIEARLEDLREAEATAREQLKLVERDISAHRDFLRTPEIDRDVSAHPEELLAQAEALAARARSELGREKPDWLQIVAWVQEADRHADAALQSARSEVEAMDRRRLFLRSEKQEAQAALSRATNFARVHAGDMNELVLGKLREAESAYREAERLEAASAGQAEAALAKALEAAATAFDRAQAQADEAYALAETAFSELERLRGDAAGAVSLVQASLRDLESYLAGHGLSRSFGRPLARLRDTAPSYRPSSDKAALTHLLAQAGQLEVEIGAVFNEAKRLVKEAERQRWEEQRRQEEARRRREAERVRRSSGWGSPGRPVSPPLWRGSGSSRRSGSGRSGGGWGRGRRSGGGW